MHCGTPVGITTRVAAVQCHWSRSDERFLCLDPSRRIRSAVPRRTLPALHWLRGGTFTPLFRLERCVAQASVTVVGNCRCSTADGTHFPKNSLNSQCYVCPDFRFSSRNCSYRFKAVSRTLITEHRLRREKNVNASHRPAKTSGSRVFYAPQRARRGRLRYHHHANTLWCEEIIGVDRGTLRTVMPCTPP